MTLHHKRPYTHGPYMRDAMYYMKQINELPNVTDRSPYLLQTREVPTGATAGPTRTSSLSLFYRTLRKKSRSVTEINGLFLHSVSSITFRFGFPPETVLLWMENGKRRRLSRGLCRCMSLLLRVSGFLKDKDHS